MLCTYVCVRVRESDNNDADVHQQFFFLSLFFFIFIMSNYQAFPVRGGREGNFPEGRNQQDCLLTLNQMINDGGVYVKKKRCVAV